MRRARSRLRLIPLPALVIGLLLVMPNDARSQAQEERAREAYLEAHGLEQRAVAIEQELLAELRASGMMQGKQEKFAEAYAFILTLHGLNVPKLEKLEERGAGVLQVAISGPRASIVERATTAEVVVVGEVKDYTLTLEPGDGFRSSIIVEVEKMLKGDVPADEIVIRQRSGLTADGKYGVRLSTDLRPEPGERYLFYLSNALYRYRIAYPEVNGLERSQENIPESVKSRYFIAFGRPHRLVDGSLGRTDKWDFRLHLIEVTEAGS